MFSTLISLIIKRNKYINAYTTQLYTKKLAWRWVGWWSSADILKKTEVLNWAIGQVKKSLISLWHNSAYVQKGRLWLI